MSTDHLTLGPRNTPSTGWTRLGRHQVAAWFARGIVGTLILLSGTAIAPCAAKADITYNLTTPPYTGGTISGTITTNGATGPLSAGSISSWDITVQITSPSSSFTLTPTDSSIAQITQVSASLSQLTLTQSATVNANWSIAESATGPFVSWQLPFSATPESGNIFAGPEGNEPPAVTATSGIASPYTIGTAQTTSAVPEPSTAIGAVFGAVAFIAYGWSRHRREQRQQGAA